MSVRLAQKLRIATVAFTLLLSLPGVPFAEIQQKQIGVFSDWRVYSFEEGVSKVCYASSTPKTSEPNNAERDLVFFYVTHMPREKPPVRGEVSMVAGYPLKKGQPVRLTIDGKGFKMFSKGDTAWVDQGTDRKVVAAMKSGKSLKVEGISSKGTRTVDTYSLSGFTEALAAIDKACY